MVNEGAEKYKIAREEKKVEKRKEHLGPVRDLLLGCVDMLDDGMDYLESKEKKKARDRIREFGSQLRIAWRELRKQVRGAEGREKKKIGDSAAILQTMINELDERVLSKIMDKDWLKRIEEINTVLNSYKVNCGVAAKKIKNLI